MGLGRIMAIDRNRYCRLDLLSLDKLTRSARKSSQVR
jgi:hypothetical protein